MRFLFVTIKFICIRGISTFVGPFARVPIVITMPFVVACNAIIRRFVDVIRHHFDVCSNREISRASLVRGSARRRSPID